MFITSNSLDTVGIEVGVEMGPHISISLTRGRGDRPKMGIVFTGYLRMHNN